MTDRRVRAAQSLSWFLLIPIAMLILYLVVDFGQQVVVYHQQKKELRRVDEENQAALADTDELEAQRDYAQSDDAAERWARKLGWARPDEVPVVIMGPDIVSPSSDARRARPVAGPATPQEAWWDLFFAER